MSNAERAGDSCDDLRDLIWQWKGQVVRSIDRERPRSIEPRTHLRPIRGRDQSAITAGLSFEVAIDSFFGASHAMRPDGDQHVHSFRIQATFVASAMDDSGMIIGYREVSDLLELQARRYAKRFINEVEPFTVIQPTGENIAAVIFRDLSVAVAQRFPHGPELTAVTLWENPSSSIRVSPP